MKIIIAGAYAIGTHLARLLSRSKEDITLIDDSEERLASIGSDYDLLTMVGQPLDANLSGHFRHQHHAAMPTLHGETVATYLNVVYTNGSPSNVKNKRWTSLYPISVWTIDHVVFHFWYL